MAGLYHGHILEFPYLRVDCFTTPRKPVFLPHWNDRRSQPPRPAPNARLFLLTHIHSDHLGGLSSNFTGQIICSEETKRMLPQIEEEKERLWRAQGQREVRITKYNSNRTFGGLTGQSLVTQPYWVPTEYDLATYDGRDMKLTITLIPANHCPGAVMFLITSADAAVLHTGDVRCDDALLKSIKDSPLFQEFLLSPSTPLLPPLTSRRLNHIYIDTSALHAGDLAAKDKVMPNFIALLKNAPEEMVFYLNIWTWGWEYVIPAIAKAFNTKIHVDRYKRRMYMAAGTDKDLLASITDDPQSTRFHACDRYMKCDECKPGNGRLTALIHMHEGSQVSWDITQDNAFRQLNEEPPEQQSDLHQSYNMVFHVPFARHSSAPELRRLVELFNPRSLSPNTIPPGAKNAGEFAMHVNIELRKDMKEALLRNNPLNHLPQVTGDLQQALPMGMSNAVGVPMTDPSMTHPSAFGPSAIAGPGPSSAQSRGLAGAPVVPKAPVLPKADTLPERASQLSDASAYSPDNVSLISTPPRSPGPATSPNPNAETPRVLQNTQNANMYSPGREWETPPRKRQRRTSKYQVDIPHLQSIAKTPQPKFK